jgi:hypothetical protein
MMLAAQAHAVFRVEQCSTIFAFDYVIGEHAMARLRLLASATDIVCGLASSACPGDHGFAPSSIFSG